MGEKVTARRDFLAEAEAELAHLDEYLGVVVPSAERSPWALRASHAAELATLFWKKVAAPMVGMLLTWVGCLGATAVVPVVIAYVLLWPLELLMSYVGIDNDTDGPDASITRATGLVTLALLGLVFLPGEKRHTASNAPQAAEPAPPAAASISKEPAQPVAPTAEYYPWPEVARAIGWDSDIGEYRVWYVGKGCRPYSAGRVAGAHNFVLERDHDGVTLTFGDDVGRVKSVHVDRTRTKLSLYSFLVESASTGLTYRPYASRAACLIDRQRRSADPKPEVLAAEQPLPNLAVTRSREKRESRLLAKKRREARRRREAEREAANDLACSIDPDCID